MKPLRMFLANVTYRLRHSPQVVPPMGIMSLAAYLRTKFKLDIELFNLRLTPCSMEELARKVAAFQPDIVGFGSLTASAHLLPPLTQHVREALPQALIALGGPAATADGTALLRETGADVAIRGEGELAFEAVIREWFEGDRRLETIPGLWWRNHEGDVIENPGDPPVITDLDSLPFPAYDLIDLKAYWKESPFGVIPNRRYASILTSRGCPYPCIYCQHALGRTFRPQSPERIVDEIEHRVHTYGVDTIEVLDDIFNFDPQRVLAFRDLLVARNLKIHLTFPNGVRGDLLTEEVTDALLDAGMDHLTVALESASPRIQELAHKRLDIDRFLQNVTYAARRRVLTQCYNIIGFPTETEEEMRLTVDTVLGLPIHMATFFTATPFPGTELHALTKAVAPEKLASIDWRNLETITARINLSTVPDHVLFGLQGEALRRFYMNPRRIARILRDHPTWWTLGHLGYILALRSTKGLFG